MAHDTNKLLALADLLTPLAEHHLQTIISLDMHRLLLDVVAEACERHAATTRIELTVTDDGEIKTEIAGRLPLREEMESHLRLLRADWSARSGKPIESVAFVNK